MRDIGAASHYLSLVVDQGEDLVLQLAADGKIWTPARVRLWDHQKRLWFIGTAQSNISADANGHLYLIFPSSVTAALAPGSYWWDLFTYVQGYSRETVAGCFRVRYLPPLSTTESLEMVGYGNRYYDDTLYPSTNEFALDWSPVAAGFRRIGEGVIDTTEWSEAEESAPVLPGGFEWAEEVEI